MLNSSVTQLKPGVGYERPLLPALSRIWWALALRGLLAVLFGLTAFFLPRVTFESLVPIFGAYALVDGVLAIIAAAKMVGRNDRRWLLLEGAAGASIGGLALAWPGLTAPALLNCVAAWAAVTGFFEIAGAVRLRREVQGERALISGGIASVVLGFVLAVLPGVGILSFLWILGIYALVFGALLIACAFRVQGRKAPTREAGPWMRSRRKRPPSPRPPGQRSRSERAPRARRRGNEAPAGRGAEVAAPPPEASVVRDSEAPAAGNKEEATVVRCQRIKSNGERCKGRAVRGSDWCAVHHPDYQEKRRQNAAKKKAQKAGGRGRLPNSSDLNEVQDLIRSTLLGVYEGKIDRSVGMAMFQGCGVLLQTIETQKKLVELEDSMARLEAMPDEREGGKKRRLG